MTKESKTKVMEFDWCEVLDVTLEVPKGYKSIEQISKETGLGVSGVSRRLKLLMEQGTVSKVQCGNKSYYKPIINKKGK